VAESGAAGGAALPLELIECIHGVAEEMESIGYLNGVWCAQSDSISDAESTITRNDLGTRMLSQPTRQGCRFIVGQHVNGPADSQVDQEQAIPQWPSVQREIIHPQLRGRLTHSELLVAQQTAQSITDPGVGRSSTSSSSVIVPAARGPAMSVGSYGSKVVTRCGCEKVAPQSVEPL